MNTYDHLVPATLYEESHSGWTTRPHVEGGAEILDQNGWPLARINYDYRYTCNATNHHRAKLFAAAPEMLAALQAIGAFPITNERENMDAFNMARMALAAIAKANE